MKGPPLSKVLQKYRFLKTCWHCLGSPGCLCADRPKGSERPAREPSLPLSPPLSLSLASKGLASSRYILGTPGTLDSDTPGTPGPRTLGPNAPGTPDFHAPLSPLPPAALVLLVFTPPVPLFLSCPWYSWFSRPRCPCFCHAPGTPGFHAPGTPDFFMPLVPQLPAPLVPQLPVPLVPWTLTPLVPRPLCAPGTPDFAAPLPPDTDAPGTPGHPTPAAPGTLDTGAPVRKNWQKEKLKGAE